MPRTQRPRFRLGELVTTPGALDLLDRAGVNATELLTRHERGDWGVARPREVMQNRRALRKGGALTSVFEVGDKHETLLIVTEVDRCITTLLLPQEVKNMRRRVLLQCLHPSLQLGWTVSRSGDAAEMPVYCRQGTWDGACGQHCLGMALALLGEIRNVTVLNARRKGRAQRLWEALPSHYFTGTTLADLAALARSLQTRHVVTEFAGTHGACLAFVQAAVLDGQLVMTSWRNRRRDTHHWTLIVGIEGRQTGAHFFAQALLALDPSVEEPLLCGYNARLDLLPLTTRRRAKGLRYLTADGARWTVTLTGALAIGERS